MGDQNPVTTIPPFSDLSKLPACAVSCGPLYDANGACVPPAFTKQGGAAAYTSCFCQHATVSLFSKGSSGVCDQACPQNAQGLSSIAHWFQGICTAGGAKDDSSTTTDSSSSETGKSHSGSGGGDWISNHWQWVIMIVILVVGIIGIWIGACIWRRRYLRKKDRQTSLAQKTTGTPSRPSWGPGMSASGSGSVAPTPYDPAAYHEAAMGPTRGTTDAAAAEAQEKAKKSWRIRERT